MPISVSVTGKSLAVVSSLATLLLVLAVSSLSRVSSRAERAPPSFRAAPTRALGGGRPGAASARRQAQPELGEGLGAQQQDELPLLAAAPQQLPLTPSPPPPAPSPPAPQRRAGAAAAAGLAGEVAALKDALARLSQQLAAGARPPPQPDFGPPRPVHELEAMRLAEQHRNAMAAQIQLNQHLQAQQSAALQAASTQALLHAQAQRATAAMQQHQASQAQLGFGDRVRIKVRGRVRVGLG